MAGIVHRAGGGDSLFGGRIVIKADLDELALTESRFDRARPGAEPHVHRRHADSFYVLEGELAFLIEDEERLLGAGACVCAPAGVVHAFRTTSPARFLNLHTPDAGFAGNLRALDRGDPGGFDSFDAPVGSGLPGANAIVLHRGEGERFEGDTRVATIKIGLEELSLIEFELEPSFEGPEPHAHDDHADSFYVVEGKAAFRVGDEELVLDAGSFACARPGVVHTFSAGPERSRLLNIHAPSAGFHDWLREVA